MRRLLAILIFALALPCYGQILAPIMQKAPVAVGGPWVLDQTVDGSAGNITITPTATTNHVLVLLVGVKGATGAVSAITDNQGDTWTCPVGGQSPNNASLNETYQICYLISPSNTAAHGLTITFSGGGSGSALTVFEVHPPSGVPSFDVAGTGAQGTGTPTMNITTAGAGELIIGGVIGDNATGTVGSGLTTGGSPWPRNGNWWEYPEYTLNSASGTQAFALVDNVHYSIIAVAFKHN